MFKLLRILIFHWKFLKVTKTIENKTKERKEFLGMLFGTLGASLLGNMLTWKWILIAGNGKWLMRADYGSKIDF